METIERSVSNLLEADLIKRDFTVLWHAGEPLVMSIDFYEEAFRTIRDLVPPEIKVTHSFQTNGLLVNSKWCDFFIRNRIELGISIDGYEAIHDLNRRTWNNKGTFKLVLKAIELLKSSNIKLNVITVVTRETLKVAKEIYQFFYNLGVNSLSFNIEEIEGCNTVTTFIDIKNIKELVKEFFFQIYQLHIQHNEPFKIREINWAKSRILNSDLNPKEILLTQLTCTYSTITIDCQGNFTTFSPELIANPNTYYGTTILGNVWTTSFKDALNSDKYKTIHNDLMLGLERCKNTCNYYGLCSGGTPSNKISEHGTLNSTETLQCKLSFQAPIDMILGAVEKEKTAPNSGLA